MDDPRGGRRLTDGAGTSVRPGADAEAKGLAKARRGPRGPWPTPSMLNRALPGVEGGYSPSGCGRYIPSPPRGASARRSACASSGCWPVRRKRRYGRTERHAVQARPRVVSQQAAPKIQASAWKASGKRHIAAKAAMVSLPSVSPPR